MIRLPASLARSETEARPAPERVPAPALRLREGLSGLRSQLLFKALDAVLTAPLQTPRPLRAELRTLFHPGGAHYRRVAALVQIADHLRPGIAQRLQARLFQPERLPFTFDAIRLLAHGSGGTLYLVDRGEQRLVLKVYRRSVDRSPAELQAAADYFRRGYREVTALYNGPYTLVTPSRFLVVHSPLLGRPAAAVLQPYLAGERLDLFAAQDEAAVLALLRRDHMLHTRFAIFVERTLRRIADSGACVDLVGADNLMLFRPPGESWQLRLVDWGFFELDTLAQQSPQRAAELRRRLTRLQQLLQRLTTT